MPIGREDHDEAGSGRRRSVDRVVEVYQPSGGEQGKVRSGTGYLLDGGLVLTAAHVVQRGPAALVKIAPEPEPLACEVVWRRHDKPVGVGVDAVLLRVVDACFTPPQLPVVRWGRLVTTAGCRVEAIGFPAAMDMRRDARLEYRDAAPIRGEILPGSRLRAGRYEIRVWTPVPPVVMPEQWEHGADWASRWSGMSGAGVCAGGLLVGLVAMDPDPTGAALTAVPVESLLSDPDFRRVVGDVRSVPVELDDVLERPQRRRAHRSACCRRRTRPCAFTGVATSSPNCWTGVQHLRSLP